MRAFPAEPRAGSRRTTGRPVPGVSQALLLAVALAACGDAVTDSQQEAELAADPSPILGTWIMETRDGSLDERFTAVIERGAGTLFGEVRIPDLGQTVQLFFGEVDNWDGGGFHFFDSQTFGLPAADSLRWNVSFQPSLEIVDRCPTTGEESVRVRPARISVSTPRVNIGATYRRPGTALPGPPPPCPINPGTGTGSGASG